MSSYASLDEDSGLFYKIKQTKVNPAGKVLAPAPIVINDKPTMIEQCGTYDFTISVNGDITRITDFEYSGQTNLQVARGIGWSMFITREKWKSE